MTYPQLLLFFLILLATVASLLRLLTARAPMLPYPVVLAAAGLLLGLLPSQLPRAGPDLILLAFVPGLVFEAALGLDLAELRRHWLGVGLLATVGVALTVVLIGALAHFALGLGWASAVLLGAILAPTDPIAVTSLLRRLRAPAGLTTILEGESLFNDGTGVAVFSAVLASILGGHAGPGDAALRFLVITAVGIAAGVAIGAAGVALLRTVPDAELEILMTLVIAYGSYLAADLLHASGVVAVVAAGVVVARYGTASGRLHGRQLSGFWSLLAFVLNAVLFVMLGERLPVEKELGIAGLTLGAFAIMLAARLLPIYGLLALADPRVGRIGWAWRHFTWWGGLRGALSAALALSVTAVPGVDPRVSPAAYGVVLLSLFVQGGLLWPLARRLGLSSSAPAPA